MKVEDIKFKAKSILDEAWVQGDLIHKEDGKIAILRNGFNVSEVDPSTVCQFTGLKDCKGNEIWENDVIELRTGTQLIVMWDTNSCRFSLHKRGCGDVTFPFCKTTAKDFKVIKSKFDKDK